MSKELIVTATSLETKLAILEDDQVTEIFVERSKNKGILGNIYKGRVMRVLPGMQAAFVDIGLERHAFLYVADFSEDLQEYEELFRTDEEVVESPAPSAPTRRRSKRRRNGRETSRTRSRAPAKSKKSQPQSAKGDGARRSERPLEKPKVMAPTWPASLKTPVLPERLELGIDLGEVADDLEETGPAGQGIVPQRFDSSGDGERHRRDVSHGGGGPRRLHFATRPDTRRRRNRSNNNQAMIGDLLREGQEILVQVAKEPIGRKGARITSHVALPGRYLVFMPTVDHVGVSRKVVSDRERARLKEIVLKARGEFNKGFIVRTVAEGRSEEDLIRDMSYLTRLWERILERANRASPPALIHSEPGLQRRVIRDFVTPDFDAVRVDDEQAYSQIVEFVSSFNPDLVSKVRLYNRPKPIFDEFGVTAEIEKALKHKVWLKNGGYIVINQTEALVAIDVNTGRFVGSSDSLEETITRTNLGAVREVVRQIRLRDLGGIIIIDFIDMDESRNRQKVMEALQAELAKDKAPSKILRFNEFGLVAITRKRVKQSLEKALCQPCIFCAGTGLTKSVRTIAYSILEEARRMARHLGQGRELLLRCHPEVAKALKDGERDVPREIEDLTKKNLFIKADPLMHIEKFDLVES